MKFRTISFVFALYPLALWAQEEADEMGKPDLYGPEFQKRFVASYGVLEDREPELQELEISLLEKIGPMVEENPEFAKSMLEGMLGEETPATATFNFILANLYFNGGALEDALAEYDRAIEKFPTFRRAWKNLGMLRTRNADYDGAVMALVRSIELGDTSPDTYGMAAYSHLRVGNLMAAELAYNAAVMLEPNNIEWIEGKAQAMVSGKRFREAIPLLEELLKRNPQRAIYRIFLANVYVETEQFLKAAQVFELMHSMGEGDMATRLQLANIYSLLGMFDLSVDTFIAAKRDDLLSLLPQVLTTVRYLLDMSEKDQAKRLLGKLGVLDPLWSSENRTRFLLLESRFAALDGNSGLEESKLMDALENDPTEGEALVRLGSIHAERGEEAKAMFFFERAYTSEKHEYDALILASEVLIGARRFGESLDLLQRALNRQPTSELKLLIDQVKAAALQ
ncbi:MAG: tetratricopeptide repeat protein [Verrucomicrobiota bacterium]|nr:tetratricopeptide repeat protein [Verrucomicrobiota bacterium]